MAGSHPPAQQANRVDELIDALQREGRIGELERELEKLDPASLDPAGQETWWHYHGITAFHAGRDAEALERFQEAHKRFPDSAPIRFSLGQQHIRAGNVDRGFELFRSCLFPAVSREYALAEARYAYLWSRYEDGFLFLRPFYDAFREVRILDDHFLYVRGLPFFGTWWSCMAAFAILSGRVPELEEVTRYLAAVCHDYDFEFLQAELEAHRDDDPARLIEPLRRRLQTTPEGFPTGHTRMNLAVAEARAAPTLEAARSLLEAVALSGQDPPWLEDVRTLALAEAAHRFGDLEGERARVDAFLARQPMLFEPYHALYFHLLRYQERLKPRIWGSVSRGNAESQGEAG